MSIIPSPLLSVKDLTVTQVKKPEQRPLVNHISFDIYAGETVCLVGESGSGKTLTSMALMSLLPETLRCNTSHCLFNRHSLLDEKTPYHQIDYGRDIAMIFQDPMSSLNPVMKIGEQIDETLARHQPNLNRRQRLFRAEEVLLLTGIKKPQNILKSYPHQLSGGLCQRVLIAIALSNNPRLIIADEPTTALDVTVQAQVMETLKKACAETGTALLLITHDMGLVAQYSDRVLVMYAGALVEQGKTSSVLEAPAHPYTRALLDSVPDMLSDPDIPLNVIPGEVISLSVQNSGCLFFSRCSYYQDRARCRVEVPALTASEVNLSHRTACHFTQEINTQRPESIDDY